MSTIHVPKEFETRFVEIYEDCIFRPNDSVKDTPNVFNAKHGDLGIDIFFDMDKLNLYENEFVNMIVSLDLSYQYPIEICARLPKNADDKVEPRVALLILLKLYSNILTQKNKIEILKTLSIDPGHIVVNAQFLMRPASDIFRYLNSKHNVVVDDAVTSIIKSHIDKWIFRHDPTFKSAVLSAVNELSDNWKSVYNSMVYSVNEDVQKDNVCKDIPVYELFAKIAKLAWDTFNGEANVIRSKCDKGSELESVSVN